MPELPDVEHARGLLADQLVDRPANRLQVIDHSAVRNTTPRRLAAMVERSTFAAVERRGKWLIGWTDDPALILHLGITGALVVVPVGDPPDRFDRVSFVGETELRYRDRRKLGGIWLSAHADLVDSITGQIGPDARRLSLEELGHRIGHRRAALKPLLMDQHVIAGLGNMLSDEVLWTARLRPTRPASTLDHNDLQRLHRALGDVVERSIRAGKIPRTPRWLSSQRTSDEPICPRCGTGLIRQRVAGRTALWCPTCQ